MSALVTIAAFVVALGLLIVFHELGHYWVARLCGVKVLRFSVGFGRPLLSRRFGRDQTEWVVAMIPLGGYVKMVDERENSVSPVDLPRAFNRQPIARRFAIVAAGPVANFIFAILVYWFLFVHGVPGLKPIIDAPPSGTPAAQAGFLAGDALLSISGEPVQTWQEARWALLKQAVRRSVVIIEARSNPGVVRSLTMDLSGLTAEDLDADFLKLLGMARLQPALSPIVDRIVTGGAAEKGGLNAGDDILSVDGRRMTAWSDVVALIRSNPERPLRFEVERNGARVILDIAPTAAIERGLRIGLIGAAGPRVPPEVLQSVSVDVRYGWWEGLGKAVAKTWDTSVFSLRMLGKMIVGEVSLRNLSGPITIADYAGQSAQIGWIPYLTFLALISISLGVLNLLPVPLLDGGHLMYYTVEFFKGSPVSEKVMEIGQHVGIALLFSLMVLAIYNDINRLISG